MREIADKIALLHKLCGEVNEHIADLSKLGVGVEVRAASNSLDYSAVDTRVKLEITLGPKPGQQYKVA